MEELKISWKLKKKAQDILSKEKGAVIKDPGGKVRVALVYPNTYHVGMSSLALHAIYRLLNDLDYCVVERAFLPDPVDIEEFKRTNTRLFTIETQTPLDQFDIIAFSASFEEDYLNIVRILQLANIPIFAIDRDASSPLVVIGGAAVSLNPEPIADLFDLVIVGDGERAMLEVIDRFRENSLEGRPRRHADFVSIAGVYVPSLYEIIYDKAIIKEVKPIDGAPGVVSAGKLTDPDEFPMPMTAIITPDTVFVETVLMEIEKGCGRSCRFCAAGFLYLPPRWRAFDLIKEAMSAALKETGKVGLVGAAVSEYPRLKELLSEAIRLGGEITLSSIRAEMLDAELAGLLKDCGYKTLTIAPEAGSQRLRNVINKCTDEAGILDVVRIAREAGFRKLKLYFLAGLPTETDEDALEIAGLTARIREEFKGSLTVSINPFIPKPVTPFQWHSFERMEVLEERFLSIKALLKGLKGVKVNIFSPRLAFFQAALSRGDRRLAHVIADAALVYGGSLKRAFKAHESNVPFADDYAYRERGEAEILPWDIIDHNINKDYLYEEYQRGLKAKKTAPCVVGTCTRCGVC